MTKANVLIVDDREENLLALSQLLKQQQVQVLAAKSGDEALELLLAHEVALALIDVQMPLMDGFTLAEMMRGTERTREIPIILITAGLRDSIRLFRGYESGAVDFLFKPVEPRILNGKVAVFVGLHRQKQQLLATQERLKRALAQSREAARVREQVVSLVTHDLRSPLASIELQTALLRRQLLAKRLDEAAAATMLERIERGSARMTRLIGELLDVTQLQAGYPLTLDCEDVDVVALARQVAEEHAHNSSRHSIDIEAEAAIIEGHWDKVRLERVLDNLISNAIKYSPDGGRVLVELRQCRDDGLDWALVRVHDEGIGIPTHSLPRLFKWFSRADNVGPIIPGTGLGLAGVRHIVMQHGGVVSARSSEGEGSVFAIGLPLRADRARTPAKDQADRDWNRLLLSDC